MRKTKKLAIIPARGGSQTIPKKNFTIIGNQTLVGHGINTAKKTKIFDKIVLSTDDDEIAEIGEKMKIEVYKRPQKYASNTATVLQALLELMKTFEKQGRKYDIICQMLPTCPFKKPGHIIDGFKMLDKKTDSVIAISEYDFPITKSLVRKNSLIKPYWKNSPFLTGKTRTQDQQIFYHDNGAFYITWWKSLKKNKNFYKGKVKGFVVPQINAIDVDGKFDLLKARLLFKYSKKANADKKIKEALSHIK